MPTAAARSARCGTNCSASRPRLPRRSKPPMRRSRRCWINIGRTRAAELEIERPRDQETRSVGILLVSQSLNLPVSQSPSLSISQSLTLFSGESTVGNYHHIQHTAPGGCAAPRAVGGAAARPAGWSALYQPLFAGRALALGGP